MQSQADRWYKDVAKMEFRPQMTIQVQEILESWAQEWEEDLLSNTEEWELIAFPLLSEDCIALLFQNHLQKIDESEQGYQIQSLAYFYRVLIFDIKTGVLLHKYRFHLFGEKAVTVIHHQNLCYAVICKEGDQTATYELFPITAQSGERITLGSQVSCAAVSAEQQLLIGNLERETDISVGNENSVMRLLSDGKTLNIQKQSETKTIVLPLDHACKVWMNEAEELFALVASEAGYFLYQIGSDGQMHICTLETDEFTARMFAGCFGWRDKIALLYGESIYIIDLSQNR